MNYRSTIHTPEKPLSLSCIRYSSKSNRVRLYMSESLMKELGWLDAFSTNSLYCSMATLPGQPDVMVLSKADNTMASRTAKVSATNEYGRGNMSLVTSVWWQDAHFELCNPSTPAYTIKTQNNGAKCLVVDTAGLLIRTTKSKALRPMPADKKRNLRPPVLHTPPAMTFESLKNHTDDRPTLAQLVSMLNDRVEEAHKNHEDMVLKIVKNPETVAPRLRIERIAVYE